MQLITGEIQKSMEGSSWIRKMFEKGLELKAQYGEDAVYDFSLGNPDVPPPPATKEALESIAADAVKPLGVRTYGSDAGKADETPTGDWRNIGILLVRVSDFSLKNIKVVNSHSWAISLEYCTEGEISDLGFYSDGTMEINGKPERTLNKDGLDLRRGCRNITIENIYGATGDDLVALTAIPTTIRPAGQFGEHEFLGSSENIEDEYTSVAEVGYRAVEQLAWQDIPCKIMKLI